MASAFATEPDRTASQEPGTSHVPDVLMDDLMDDVMDDVMDVPMPLAVATPLATPLGSLSLAALADTIVTRHHAFLREQGTAILAAFARLDREPDAWQDDFQALQTAFRELHLNLLGHQHREETVLFPYCRLLEISTQAPKPQGSLILGPVRLLQHDHHDARAQMLRLFTLSRGFSAAATAPAGIKALYRELRAYQDDLDLHFRLEDQLLFPAALALERRLRERMSP